MVPAAVVDSVIKDLSGLMSAGDILIDGGNSYYKDDIARSKMLAPKELHYVDVGTSGGVWGLERGYCLMIGGEKGIEHPAGVFRIVTDDQSGPKPQCDGHQKEWPLPPSQRSQPPIDHSH